jgi:hypothetical protein
MFFNLNGIAHLAPGCSFTDLTRVSAELKFALKDNYGEASRFGPDPDGGAGEKESC